jgi:hypothetical protein
MEGQAIETTNEIARNRHFSLLELLDRLLDKGVMVKGEIVLSVADIDLVYLNLGLLLSSVKTVEKAAREGRNREYHVPLWPPAAEAELLYDPLSALDVKDNLPALLCEENSSDQHCHGAMTASALPAVIDNKQQPFSGQRANTDSANVEKGLTRLVLTLVELIRKLMEKQAIRRIEADQLSAKEIEKVGDAFFLLDERMQQLKGVFDLADEDLNLDLGPLGELI